MGWKCWSLPAIPATPEVDVGRRIVIKTRWVKHGTLFEKQIKSKKT
jgi:hypothetical protein